MREVATKGFSAASQWPSAPHRLDLAKNVFQAHGVNASGKIVIRKAIRRSQVLPFLPSCRRALWALKPGERLITGPVSFLALGHDVRLMPPAYVKPKDRLDDW